MTKIKEQLAEKWQWPGLEKFFRLCGICLFHIWYYSFGYCVIYGNWVLDGCEYFIICPIYWVKQISLESRKWLIYKDFFNRYQNTSIITMTIEKKISNFCQLYPKFSHFNLFNCICKDWSTSLRRFNLLEGAQQIFFALCPQESLFRDAGHSVHSSVLAVEMNCPLHFIKVLSTLDDNFAAESLLEKCIETVHVFVFETECTEIL